MIRNVHNYLTHEYNKVTGKFVFDKITKWFEVRTFMTIRLGVFLEKNKNLESKALL